VNILVTNSHSVRNAGDRVLLEVTLEELRANFPDANFTVAIDSLNGVEEMDAGAHYVGAFMSWFRTEENGRERWDWRRLPALPWWAIQSLMMGLTARLIGRPWPQPRDVGRRRLLWAYCQSDLIVSCPGNFFYSGGGPGIAFLLHVVALGFGWLLGKPLYMMPQTIGPITRRRERWLLMWLLRRMRFVALRDERSLAPVLMAGVPPERCHILADSAFLFRGSGDLSPFMPLISPEDGEIRQNEPVPSLAARRPRPYLGVTVIDWGIKNRNFTGQETYERAVSAAVEDFLARHGGSAFIFPQVTGPSLADDDRIPARRVAGLVNTGQSHMVQIDATLTPGQLRAAYGQMDVFLGARLHSNIFALTTGTPVLAVAYQYKTNGVMGMLGLSEWVVNIEDARASRLSERLEALWQRRAEVGALIQQALPALQQDARRAAALIAADYAQLLRPPRPTRGAR
jgi:colanic acid/amylovoran biosynthesis protein